MGKQHVLISIEERDVFEKLRVVAAAIEGGVVELRWLVLVMAALFPVMESSSFSSRSEVSAELIRDTFAGVSKVGDGGVDSESKLCSTFGGTWCLAASSCRDFCFLNRSFRRC